MKTDNRKLFEYSIISYTNYGYKINEISLDLYNDQIENNIPTEYEIKFKNNEGAYTHTLWEPMGDDFNDTETPYRNPSRVKQTLALIKLLISAVNPTIMDKLSIKCSSWDELRKLVIDSTNPGKGTEVQIKLLKNNKGEGIFPMYFYSYNKEMEPYFSSYFIGKHLKFTDKELKRMEATPTVAPTGVSEAAPAEDTGLIFNL